MTRDDMIAAAVLGFPSSLYETSVPAGRFWDAYLTRHGGTLPPSDVERIRNLYRMIERVVTSDMDAESAVWRRSDPIHAPYRGSFRNLRLIG